MPSNGSFSYGPYGFLYKKNTGVGVRRNPKIGLICGQKTYLYNKFSPGQSGVGALNTSVRRSKNRLATICTGKQPCGSFYNTLGLYHPHPMLFYPTVINTELTSES